MSETKKYKRVIFKLSGEALAGEKGFGIDPEVVYSLAKQIKTVVESGLEVAIVNGGGLLSEAVEIVNLFVPKGDTLYFYDGPDTSSRLILKCNNNVNPLSSTNKIYAGPDNESGIITIRLKTGAFGVGTHSGFTFLTGCDIPCELVTPHISRTYYKYKDGEMYSKGQVEFVYQTETVSY